MSVHLVACAAPLPLKPSEKLVLLCLAENANAADGRAFPGMRVLREWTGLSAARVQELLNRLMEYELIVQVAAGHRGRAAEFVVFPHGCCPAHGKSTAPDELEAIAEKASSGPAAIPADLACGNTDRPEAIDRKASSSGRESLQSGPGKPPVHRRPTNYPPNYPPAVEYQPQPQEPNPWEGHTVDEVSAKPLPAKCNHGFDSPTWCAHCRRGITEEVA